MPDARNARVLVVDDDPQVRHLFREYLEGRYEIETAAGGEDALERVTDAVDVVLLDRMMPDVSGDEVLAELRSRGLDCRVAMVTALEPDVDVADRGFDDYVIKPATRSELHNTVDSLLRWEQYDEVVREFFGAARRVAVLEERLGTDERSADREYQRLVAELDALKDEANTTLEEFEGIDPESAPKAFGTVESRPDSGER